MSSQLNILCSSEIFPGFSSENGFTDIAKQCISAELKSGMEFENFKYTPSKLNIKMVYSTDFHFTPVEEHFPESDYADFTVIVYYDTEILFRGYIDPESVNLDCLKHELTFTAYERFYFTKNEELYNQDSENGFSFTGNWDELIQKLSSELEIEIEKNPDSQLTDLWVESEEGSSDIKEFLSSQGLIAYDFMQFENENAVIMLCVEKNKLQTPENTDYYHGQTHPILNLYYGSYAYIYFVVWYPLTGRIVKSFFGYDGHPKFYWLDKNSSDFRNPVINAYDYSNHSGKVKKLSGGVFQISDTTDELSMESDFTTESEIQFDGSYWEENEYLTSSYLEGKFRILDPNSNFEAVTEIPIRFAALRNWESGLRVRFNLFDLSMIYIKDFQGNAGNLAVQVSVMREGFFISDPIMDRLRIITRGTDSERQHTFKTGELFSFKKSKFNKMRNLDFSTLWISPSLQKGLRKYYKNKYDKASAVKEIETKINTAVGLNDSAVLDYPNGEEFLGFCTSYSHDLINLKTRIELTQNF